MTDAVTLYLERFARSQQNAIVRSLVRIELKRIQRFESIIAQFDRGLVCSEVDRQYLERAVPGARLDLLYNGVDLEQFSPMAHAEPEPYRMIFTGNMSYFPNQDGAMFFISKIFPLILQEVPQAELFLVGQNPPRRLRALAGEQIHVTGFVPDIRAEYLRSAVAVSPIRFGAGTLNKVLEPLALGVPVVSTSIGIEGMGLRPGEDIIVADDAGGFARAVVRLLKDEALRRAIGSSATERIRSRFGWARIAHDLEEIYEQVLRERKTR